MNCDRYTLIDVLHKLIASETAQIQPLYKDCRRDGRSKGKTKADLVLMRKLSKRDAYYRVIHILRGNDSEYPAEKIHGIEELVETAQKDEKAGAEVS